MGAEGMKMKKVVLLLVVVLVFGPAAVESALSCGQVVSYVAGCLPYVRGGLLGGCCGGVRRLYYAARTTADRRTVCYCLKSLGQYAGPRVTSLPSICGLSLPYKISPSTNCATIR